MNTVTYYVARAFGQDMVEDIRCRTMIDAERMSKQANTGLTEPQYSPAFEVTIDAVDPFHLITSVVDDFGAERDAFDKAFGVDGPRMHGVRYDYNGNAS